MHGNFRPIGLGTEGTSFTKLQRKRPRRMFGCYRFLAAGNLFLTCKRNLMRKRENSLPMDIGWHTPPMSQEQKRCMFGAFLIPERNGKFRPLVDRHQCGAPMGKNSSILHPMQS